MRQVAKMLGVVVLAGVTAFTAATPAAVAGGLNSDRFRVTLRTATEHFEDVGRRGPSVGDTLTFSDKVFRQGKRVGHDEGRCDLTRAGNRRITFHCVVTLSLRGKGKIAVQGPLTFGRRVSHPGRLAITGGTRRYAGAAGSVEVIEQRGEPTRLLVRLRG